MQALVVLFALISRFLRPYIIYYPRNEGITIIGAIAFVALIISIISLVRQFIRFKPRLKINISKQKTIIINDNISANTINVDIINHSHLDVTLASIELDVQPVKLQIFYLPKTNLETIYNRPLPYLLKPGCSFSYIIEEGRVKKALSEEGIQGKVTLRAFIRDQQSYSYQSKKSIVFDVNKGD